ncbi:MAG TPA: hypothetical protein VF820_01915 [Patescibacteria group bacterium]
MIRNKKIQLIPIILSAVTCFILVVILFFVITSLNHFPIKEKIVPVLRIADILVGLTIYLKTSIDFAIFIGNLMRKYQGLKNRIAIEIGTAVGNAFGTILILVIWTFFKEIPLLMAVMIILASLVLLRLAEESLEDYLAAKSFMYAQKIIAPIFLILKKINTLASPITQLIIPRSNRKNITLNSFFQLLFFSFSIPFILGLDDFAGYIPLFSIINVFGFATGVFLGHMLLNIALFTSPESTIKIVRLPIILILGGLAFIGIALWGFYDVLYLLRFIF